MSVLRSVVARVTPGIAKRAHQEALDLRWRRLVAGPTRAYVEREGLTVSAGPFAGLRYLDDLEAWSSDLVAKLSGQYERELHPAMREWIAAGHEHVLDVGCAEGFYAVGLAHAMPATTVHAFDVDPDALARCGRLAEHNDVADRVRLEGFCSPETLGRFPAQGVALLADCEGYERTLLDPAAAPVLERWHIVVELHEFLDARIATDLATRFAPTHVVELIRQQPRDPAEVPGLRGVSRRRAAAVLSERRPEAMRWAVMRPRDPR